MISSVLPYIHVRLYIFTLLFSCTDVIGLVTEVGNADLKWLKNQAEPTHRRQITITDTRYVRSTSFFSANICCALSVVLLFSRVLFNPPHIVLCHLFRQNEVKIYLWGERALEFDVDQICAMSETNHVVIIFVGLIAKDYRGNFSTYSSSVLPILTLC